MSFSNAVGINKNYNTSTETSPTFQKKNNLNFTLLIRDPILFYSKFSEFSNFVYHFKETQQNALTPL